MSQSIALAGFFLGMRDQKKLQVAKPDTSMSSRCDVLARTSTEHTVRQLLIVIQEGSN